MRISAATTGVTQSMRITSLVVAVLLLSACGYFASAESRIAAAEAQMAAADYRGAMIELRNVLQRAPENGHAWRLLAQTSLQLGDATSAERELRRAAENGESAESLAEPTAQVRLALGRYDELLTSIETGESALVEPARSLYQGRALQGARRFQEAADVFGQLLAGDPSMSAARIGVAEAQAGLGDIDGALAELARVNAADPDNAYAWLIRGGLLARRGQFADAQQSLELAQQHSDGQLTTQQYLVLLSALAEARLSLGAIAEAEAVHKELESLSSNAPLTRYLGARIAIVKQDYATAGADLQRLVANAPNFVAARFLLGAVLLAQGNLQQANLQLTQVVQAAPENLEARKLLAQVNLRLNHPDAAMQVLAPALQADSADPELNALFGVSQIRAGDEAGAIAFMERSLTSNGSDPALRLELAAAYLRSGRSQDALELLQATTSGGIRRTSLLIAALMATRGQAAADAELARLLAASPNDADLLNLASALLIRQSEFDRARALLSRALAAQPDDVRTLVHSARLELAAGNPTAATGPLERVLEIDPANAAARLGLSELALARGDTASAIRFLEEMRTRDARAVEPRMQLMRLFILEKRNDEAQAVLNEALANAVDAGVVHSSAGLVFLEANRYDEAIARFRAAVDVDQSQPAYWLNLSRAQNALNQGTGARDSVNRALSLQPEWLPAVGTAAMMDVRDGNGAAALGRVRTLKDKRPGDPAVLTLEGDVQLALRQYQAAAQAYDAALAVRSDSALALKAYRARHLGRLGGTTGPLVAWLESNPGDFRVRNVLAEAYQLSGQRARAIQEYEIVVRDGPNNPAVVNNLAWLYHQTGDARALDMARRAHEQAPGSPSIADTYGWLLVEAGRIDEGLALLEKAQQAAPDQPDIAYHRAAAMARAGRRDEARRQLEALLARHPQFESRPEAARLLSQLPSG